MCEFKICLVKPRIINQVQMPAGSVLAIGKVADKLTLDKVVSSIVSGKAQFEIIEKKETKK